MNTTTRPAPHGTTDPAAVRQHIRDLIASGTDRRSIADLAQVPYSTIRRILYRNPATIETDTAQAILAVSPGRRRHARAVTTDVDATGTRRRVRAMHHDGYDTSHIAAAVGEQPRIVRSWLRCARIDADHAQAVADLYLAWSGVPAETNGADPESAACARQLARRRRWAQAGAWDEDAGAIDDPNATPTPWYGVRRSADLFADSEELLAQRLPFDVVAARLDVKINTLQRARERMRARARAAERLGVAA